MSVEEFAQATVELPPLQLHLQGKSPYGAPQIDVPIRLNTNESPFQLSPELVDDIARTVATSARDANRYPDRDAVELRHELARYLSDTTGHTVGTDQVWAANGSNEVLQQLLMAFAGPGRTVLGFEPSYSMHPTLATATGATYTSVPRTEDFGIDLDEALSAIGRLQPSVIFLCTPNNPTGGSLDPEMVVAIHDASDALIVLDEAYVEFSHSASLLPLTDGRPRLVVSRTMSKAFGLAGARLGYLAADTRVIDAMQLTRLPYHLSSITQAVALAALRHRNSLLAGVEAVKEQRDIIVDTLRNKGVKVADSDSNFVLFRAPDGDSTALWKRILDAGVLIRDVGLDGYLRVTAGTPSETQRFLDVLEETA
ncbi:histidinol phosphate aminotransferase [Brevibacterium sanguinis]|uniref:Histidinol-phosphate aminotransferase n=2 Tax=Brevibacterium TaxID=1696 RepID=A0A366INZ6_9MICO|nr:MULTISPECIES: histidinol-phosphate transaminase [Brevibacterium]RBP67795.1 histidinol phosphate aminotransferase [Brevibacterium sanguinis]RBP74788.1 histidinol phosphate aminotransferase [Brevibacterium celere]